MVKNAIFLLLVTFIFSSVVPDVPNMFNGIFGGIFAHASPEAQKDVVSKLTSVCSALNQGGKIEQPGNVFFDFNKIGTLCGNYNSGKISSNEFFQGVVASAVSSDIGLQKSDFLSKYNSLMGILTGKKGVYFLVLSALLVLLYILVADIRIFMMALAGISFSIGILILVPYTGIIAYEKLVGIDTTPVLSSVFQGSFSFKPKAIVSVVLLMILKTYTSFIVALGVIFLSIGIAGKAYAWRLKGKQTAPKKQAEMKFKKGKKEIAFKSRDTPKSTKEILDELEEIHKNKLKEQN